MNRSIPHYVVQNMNLPRRVKVGLDPAADVFLFKSKMDACLLAALQSQNCKKSHTVLEVRLDPRRIPLPQQVRGCLPKVLEFECLVFLLSPQQQCTGECHPDQLLHPQL